jgi:hypothetical protein
MYIYIYIYIYIGYNIRVMLFATSVMPKASIYCCCRVYCNMVTIEEKHFYEVTSPGSKIKWLIGVTDLISSGTKYFVKLPRTYSSGFSRLVKDNNPNIPTPEPPHYSLAASVGYRQLVKLRNAAAESLRDYIASEAVPDVFRGDGFDVKRARKTMKPKKDANVEPVSLHITIPGVTDSDQGQRIEVLEPLHGCRDNLYVLFDEDTVSTIIQWLKDTPWTSQWIGTRRKDANGVYRRARVNGVVDWYKKVHDKWVKCKETGDPMDGVAVCDAEPDENGDDDEPQAIDDDQYDVDDVCDHSGGDEPDEHGVDESVIEIAGELNKEECNADSAERNGVEASAAEPCVAKVGLKQKSIRAFFK